MRPIPFMLMALALSVFGVLTVFLSGSVIFDLFNIRSHEGNYVPFVVWANMVSGLLFLTAAFGFIRKKPWTVAPVALSAVILMLALLGLIIHINAGGIYETKTVGAMIFRIIINLVLFGLLHYTARPRGIGNLIKKGVFLSMPVLVLASACNFPSDKKDQHSEMHGKSNHPHHDKTEVSSIALDNGEKWTADENTLQLVRKMESSVLAFSKTAESDPGILADSLQKDLNLLIAGCTMKGKAHEELHKWLLPHMDIVKALSNAENKADANEILRALNESFDVFNQSFK